MLTKGRWLALLLALAVLAGALIKVDVSQAQLEGLEGMEPPEDVTGADCVMCHGDFATKFEFLHEPAAGGMCEICHLPTGEGGHGGLVDETRALCLACHSEKEEHYAALTCWTSTCHKDVHGSNVDPVFNPNLQEEYPGFSVATEGACYVGTDNCLSCHAECCEGWAKSAHSMSDLDPDTPAKLKGCESCHGPGGNHNGRRAAIGVFAEASAGEADAACLTCHKDESYIPDYRATVHYRNGVACISCHNPHNTAEKHNLRSSPNEMCFACHQTKRMDFGKLSHHPVDLADPRAGMLCIDCHNPHGGEDFAMLTEPREELCVSCHTDKAGPFVFPHTASEPAFGRGCETCHDTHGSNAPNLLKINGRGLCLQCHNDRVLHFEAMTCWTAGCHTAVHGSNTDFFFFEQ